MESVRQLAAGFCLDLREVCADDDRVFETNLWQAPNWCSLGRCVLTRKATSLTAVGAVFASCLPLCL